MKYTIVTPERIVKTGETSSCTVPTVEGELTILPGHIPLLSTLQPGVVVLRHNGDEELLAVSTGFLEVCGGDELVLMADSAERADELDGQAIERAEAEAR